MPCFGELPTTRGSGRNPEGGGNELAGVTAEAWAKREATSDTRGVVEFGGVRLPDGS